jgi:hypothetical protein
VKITCVSAALLLAVLSGGCGQERTADTGTSAAGEGEGNSSQAAFTETDLEKFERGLRTEIEAVRAAQAQAASATTAQQRGEAMQAQWETATIPRGAEASGLPGTRYSDIREAVNHVFTTLDFQGKIDGPLSIDLERADAETKKRVSGDAFAGLPAEAAMALRARMDRLVPLWSEYKQLVAVAG